MGSDYRIPNAVAPRSTILALVVYYERNDRRGSADPAGPRRLGRQILVDHGMVVRRWHFCAQSKKKVTNHRNLFKRSGRFGHDRLGSGHRCRLGVRNGLILNPDRGRSFALDLSGE